MSKKEEDNKEKKEEKIDWSKIEPATLEDITVDNIVTKRLRLNVELKNGGKKTIFVEFRKLNIKESAVLAAFDFNSDGNQHYQRNILHIASITPKFPEPNEEKSWKGIDSGFMANYVKSINQYATKNDFLF